MRITAADAMLTCVTAVVTTRVTAVVTTRVTAVVTIRVITVIAMPVTTVVTSFMVTVNGFSRHLEPSALITLTGGTLLAENAFPSARLRKTLIFQAIHSQSYKP
jgi:hypothetical protein